MRRHPEVSGEAMRVLEEAAARVRAVRGGGHVTALRFIAFILGDKKVRFRPHEVRLMKRFMPSPPEPDAMRLLSDSHASPWLRRSALPYPLPEQDARTAVFDVVHRINKIEWSGGYRLRHIEDRVEELRKRQDEVERRLANLAAGGHGHAGGGAEGDREE